MHSVFWHTTSKATVNILKFVLSFTLMKDSLRERIGVFELKMICDVKYYWLEDICFKQLVDDISPKPYFFSFFTTLRIQYFHKKFIAFDIFTSVYDIRRKYMK